MPNFFKNIILNIIIILVCLIQISCADSSPEKNNEPNTSLDSDGDGLTDFDEFTIFGTDPFLIDTDNDGFGDHLEVTIKSDPNDPLSVPDYVKNIKIDLDTQLGTLWTNKNGWEISDDINCVLDGCLKSPMILPGDESDISLDVIVFGGYFQFDIVVDNACCNKVELLVNDNVVKTFQNGTHQTSSVILSDGLNHLTWKLDVGDAATMAGAVYIDNIRFVSFANNLRNLSSWQLPSGLIFTANLASQEVVEAKGGQIVGSGVQFDPQRGVNPGVSGGIVFNDFQKSLEIANKGSITFDITAEAITIDESENSAFTQSMGEPRIENAPFFVATPTSGEADEKIQWYRHLNGSLGFWEKSNGTNQAVANLALNSQGKHEYTHLGISWEGTQLDFYIDGLLYRSLTRNTAATTEAFQKFFIGRYGGKSIGDYWIKNFNVYSEPISYPKLENRVAIFGDSFAVAGFVQPFGFPLYDVSWGYQILKYFANESLFATFLPGGQSGHGYSLSNPQTLTDYVDVLLQDDPEVVFCLGSVNDVNDGLFPEDYQRSWEWVIDKLSSHPSVKKIIVTSIAPFSHVSIYDTPEVKNAQLQSNAVIAELPNYNEKVVYFDLFTAMNGFDYDSEFSIGSAIGTTNTTDLHPSPKGHVKLAELLYPVIRANLD